MGRYPPAGIADVKRLAADTSRAHALEGDRRRHLNVPALRNMEEEWIDRDRHGYGHRGIGEKRVGVPVGVALEGCSGIKVGSVREVAGGENAVEIFPDGHDMNVVAK